MFSLREDIFKKLTNWGILNDSDQSNTAKQKYKESIARKPKLEPELKPKFEKIYCRKNNIKKTKTQGNC